MTDLDILSKLPPLTWRGIEVPSQTSSVDFEQGLVEHRQHGVAGGHQENTGRGSMVLTFRIPFRTGILEYPDLYPTIFRDFWNACLDGSVGEFQHPEFGEFDAKLHTFKLSIDPQRRDGYDVDVVFKETTENDITAADNPLGPIAEAVSVAESIREPTGELSPIPEFDDGTGVDLLTALKRLEGSLKLLELTIAGKIASINNAINGVNSMIDTVNGIGSATAQLVSEGLKSIESSLQDTKATISPDQRRIEYYVASRETGVTDAAAGASMGLDEFFGLNPMLARVNTIAAGEAYFVYV